MKHTMMIASLAILPATLSPAAISVFDSSFTDGEGFTDGSVGFGAPNPDTLVGQGGFSISDSVSGTGGVGLLNGATGFQRALFGFTGADSFNVALVNGLQEGSTITVGAHGLTLPAVGNPAGTSNVLVLGLSNINDGNILGGSGLALGGRLQANSSGDIFVNTTSTFNPSLGAGADSGLNVGGSSFDWELVFTAEAGGTFTVEHKINGATLLTEVNRSFNFSNGSAETAGHLQDQGGAAGAPNNYTIDRLSLEYDIIPEPATAVLALAGLLGVMRRRR